MKRILKYNNFLLKESSESDKVNDTSVSKQKLEEITSFFIEYQDDGWKLSTKVAYVDENDYVISDITEEGEYRYCIMVDISNNREREDLVSISDHDSIKLALSKSMKFYKQLDLNLKYFEYEYDIQREWTKYTSARLIHKDSFVEECESNSDMMNMYSKDNTHTVGVVLSPKNDEKVYVSKSDILDFYGIRRDPNNMSKTWTFIECVENFLPRNDEYIKILKHEKEFDLYSDWRPSHSDLTSKMSKDTEMFFSKKIYDKFGKEKLDGVCDVEFNSIESDGDIIKVIYSNLSEIMDELPDHLDNIDSDDGESFKELCHDLLMLLRDYSLSAEEWAYYKKLFNVCKDLIEEKLNDNDADYDFIYTSDSKYDPDALKVKVNFNLDLLKHIDDNTRYDMDMQDLLSEWFGQISCSTRIDLSDSHVYTDMDDENFNLECKEYIEKWSQEEKK